MEKYEFDINMRTGDMFAFMARQQYTGLRGMFDLIINVIVVLCLVLNWENYDLTARLLLFFVLFLFDVYLPVNLYVRARIQVKNAERFQEGTHYLITGEGITVSQGEESVELLWGHLQKYKATGKRIYVYTSRITAFIFPKEQIGSEAYDFLIKRLKANKAEFGMKSLDTAKCVVPQDKDAAGDTDGTVGADGTGEHSENT